MHCDAFQGIYSVYIHKCPNEMIYVGQTGKLPKRRWREGYGYSNQALFFNDIQRYGWDNIEHIIVGQFEDKAKALQLERKLVQENKDHCYNVKGLSTSKYAEYDFKHRNKI